jgi:adenylate cyclase
VPRDYFAEIVRFGVDGDPSRGMGVGCSFATDRPEGFRDDDLLLMKAVLPAISSRQTAQRATNLSVYDLYLRALAVFFPITKERIVHALELLEQAIVIDRHYAPALSWAAGCHSRLVVDGWADDPETSRQKANDLARRALEAGESDPSILVNTAQVLAYYGEDIAAMIGLVDRALALNPNFARGWFVSGHLRVWAGQPDVAIEHIETALRLSPRERIGSTGFVIGVAYFVKRQFEEAAAKLLLSVQENPGFPMPYRYLAACYAHMGRLDEARTIIAQLRAITPLVIPSDLPFRSSKDRKLFLSGLRLAAGEPA